MLISYRTERMGRSKQAGFSLLELSAVLLLMTIMLGFSLPMFSNYFDSRLKKETLKIAKIVDDLRTQAILQHESYQLVFDTKKSHYAVYTIDPQDSQKLTPHRKYNTPILLAAPVQFASVSTEIEDEVQSVFRVEKLEFEKIFGQTYQFKIDDSGFIDRFALRLRDNENMISLTITNIMGDIAIGEEKPLSF